MSNNNNVIGVDLQDYLVEEEILELFERELANGNISEPTIDSLSEAFDWSLSLKGFRFWVGHSENMDKLGLYNFS